MRIIELDAKGWKTVHDFYDALLTALGAPSWHGRSPDALIDSVIWGGINAVNPPLMIRIHGLGVAPKAVVDEVKLAKRALDEGREDFRVRQGRDIEVQLQIEP